ncbi:MULTISPECIES: hypothetical protein [unclassified Streptomyces]|uniref:hypothetical protein n=1 Tax=unclassified Streptomyces TaxID=2593676 RepID=UPI00236629A9|nr:MULTISPECIES: hypothetical protein [unclassified Streptomyces]MDF3143051.1 hypothetical protein [Streptomyces sp. T21Q-yed]WDF44439.1 hypothetical protein PBV52_50505 [Streptomyces sp. T12]
MVASSRRSCCWWRYQVQAARHGSYALDVGDGARTEVLFHLPLEEIVRRRVAHIARHQQARERPGLLAHAFVPVDTRTGLTQSTSGRQDWTDGAERIAMPLLLQAAAARGLASPTRRRSPRSWTVGPTSPAATSWTRAEPHGAVPRSPSGGCTTPRGWPSSSTIGTAPTAGRKTSTPASSSAASNSAGPHTCPSVVPP